MKKRILSALLSLVMVLSLLPTVALAATEDHPNDGASFFLEYGEKYWGWKSSNGGYSWEKYTANTGDNAPKTTFYLEAVSGSPNVYYAYALDGTTKLYLYLGNNGNGGVATNVSLSTENKTAFTLGNDINSSSGKTVLKVSRNGKWYVLENDSSVKVCGDTGCNDHFDIVAQGNLTYTITYNLDGGALAAGVTNPTSYTVNTETFTLKNPTKEG